MEESDYYFNSLSDNYNIPSNFSDMRFHAILFQESERNILRKLYFDFTDISVIFAFDFIHNLYDNDFSKLFLLTVCTLKIWQAPY
jgi:hypothetical protein